MKGWFAPAAGTVLLWAAWVLLSDAAAQVLSGHHGVILEIIGAGVVGLPLCNPPFRRLGALYAVLSGLLSISGILFFLYALKAGDAIVVVPIASLYPAVTLLLGMTVLNEQITQRQAFGIVCAITGVIFISL